MADIELVIKIPEETYEYWKEHKHEFVLAEATANGTLLPKGHGRLIDADKLYDYFWDNRSRYFLSADCRVAIDNAQTIIEADKEDKDADSN